MFAVLVLLLTMFIRLDLTILFRSSLLAFLFLHSILKAALCSPNDPGNNNNIFISWNGEIGVDIDIDFKCSKLENKSRSVFHHVGTEAATAFKRRTMRFPEDMST